MVQLKKKNEREREREREKRDFRDKRKIGRCMNYIKLYVVVGGK